MASHIRPKRRKPAAKKTVITPEVVDVEVEAARQQMESWMGLSEDKDAKLSTPPAAAQDAAASTIVPKTTSILKEPKYTNKKDKPQFDATEDVNKRQIEEKSAEDEPKQVPPTEPAHICKSIIVERDPMRPPPPRPRNRPSKNDALAVEGYVPSGAAAAAAAVMSPKSSDKGEDDKATDPTDEEDDEQEKDLILSSVADLIDASGILKKPEDPTKITDDTQMLEADIAFSCMTPEEYDETKRDEDLEREAHFRIFQGRDSVFSAEDDRLDDDGVLSEADDDSQAGDDGEGMDDLLSRDGIDDDFNDEDDDNILDFDEDDIDGGEEKEPRAFLKLWSTLSEWVTPQAVEWLVNLEKNVDTSSPSRTTFHDWTPQVDRSDLGASRCAGLMAMVKMNLSTSLKELNRGSDLHRQAELRLGDWLRTFDYSAPMAKLHLSLWKALTCILLDIVLVETSVKATEIALPKSVATIGMTLDEYRYITRSAVQSLGKTL